MSQLQLIRERRFGPLFWTQFLGALNDNLFKTAFVFLITFGALSGAHDGGLWTPILNGLLILPFFLFSAFAGQLADKFEKAKLVRLIKLWELAVMAVAAAGFITQNVWLLAGALFLMGTQSAFFGPVKYAILPESLDPKTLVSGNALVGGATFLAILMGTMLGGLLMEAGGWASTATALLLLVVAAAGYLTSRRIPEGRPSDPELRFDWNPVRQAIKACRFAAEDRSVFRSILGVSWFWFFGATLLTLFPTYGKQILHVNEQVVTFFLMLFCIGIGVGSLACGHFARHRLKSGLVAAGAVGLSVFLLDLFFASLGYEPIAVNGLVGLQTFLLTSGSLRIVLDLLGIAICGGLFVVPQSVLVQERSPARRRSRVLAASGILSALFMVVSAAMTYGYAALGIPSVYVYLVVALMNAAVVVYIFKLVPDLFASLIVWLVVRLVYRPRVEGLENIPRDGAVLLAANHVTYVDGFILAATLGRPVRFVMYYKFGELPLVGTFLRWARVIPIAGRSESPGILKSAMDEIARALKNGEAVCIFPEGSLTDDGEVRTFRKGIEHIVARTPVPVVPMGLSGLWGSLFSRAKKRLRDLTLGKLSSRVGISVGAPIPVGHVSADHVREQVAALRGALA